MRDKDMSTKRKTYSAEFKAKVVLEVLEGEQTLNQIASKYELLPANVKNWKKIFLENMSLAFDKSTVVKEYKEKIETLEKSNDSLAKKLETLQLKRIFSWKSYKARSPLKQGKPLWMLSIKCHSINSVNS